MLQRLANNPGVLQSNGRPWEVLLNYFVLKVRWILANVWKRSGAVKKPLTTKEPHHDTVSILLWHLHHPQQRQTGWRRPQGRKVFAVLFLHLCLKIWATTRAKRQPKNRRNSKFFKAAVSAILFCHKPSNLQHSAMLMAKWKHLLSAPATQATHVCPSFNKFSGWRTPSTSLI